MPATNKKPEKKKPAKKKPKKTEKDTKKGSGK